MTENWTTICDDETSFWKQSNIKSYKMCQTHFVIRVFKTHIATRFFKTHIVTHFFKTHIATHFCQTTCEAINAATEFHQFIFLLNEQDF